MLRWMIDQRRSLEAALRKGLRSAMQRKNTRFTRLLVVVAEAKADGARHTFITPHLSPPPPPPPPNPSEFPWTRIALEFALRSKPGSRQY